MWERGTVVLAFAVASCCESPIALVDEPVTDEQLALPVIAQLEDVAPADRASNGCEYGDERHRAKLGPLAASYTAWDYKGQTVTTNAALFLSSPTCTRTTVSFVMESRSSVRLRHDPKRDVYIVTNGDAKSGAVTVRIAKR